MRDLEFRIWDKQDKLFLYADVIFGFFPLLPAECESDKHLFADRFSDPMQYTGVKDRNGQKIYEGDIINASRFNPGIEVKIPDIYLMQRDPGPTYWFRHPEELELVGNIYEKSEVSNERD